MIWANMMDTRNGAKKGTLNGVVIHPSSRGTNGPEMESIIEGIPEG